MDKGKTPAHCVNAACHRPIGDGLAFCPFCGADNRAPVDRSKVQCAAHETVDGGGACVRCGTRLGADGLPLRGPAYRLVGLLMLVLGLGLAGVGSYWMVFALCFMATAGGGIGLGLAAAGAYFIWHGLHRIRGVAADGDWFDDVDPR